MSVNRSQQHFALRIEPYRTELLAHCYRMLGSAHDAEDVVQETYLRAWRARAQYDDARGTLRTWMYRIATNACLTALKGSNRRPLPSGIVAESDPRGPFVPGDEVSWLQPLPDALVDGVDRLSLRLAFVAALQHLTPRQRAVLILRDVLDFTAAETAEIIGGTEISVNSALRRARTAVGGANPEHTREPPAGEQRAVVERYMAAFVAGDVDAIKQLLADEVLMEMPPMTNWFSGRDNYVTFMRWVFDQNGTDWRVRSVAANGQPAFAAYRGVAEAYVLHTLQVFTVSSTGISRLSVFQDPEVFAAFALAPRIDPGTGPADHA